MRAFVTGASGFVAGWLLRHLSDMGDDLETVDESVDIADADAMRERILAAAPEAIYHLAAFTHVGKSWEEPAEAFRVNALGTLQVLQAARLCRPAPRVLLIGSAEVYGMVKPDQLPVREDAPLLPVSPYAASKVAAEFLGVQAHLGYGVPVIRVRAFNHIGPGQHPSFVVPALVARIREAQAQGQGEVRVGNVSPRRDFTDVRDVVRAYRLLVERGRPGEAYNVCSGRDVSIGHVAERLLELAGGGLELVNDPELERPVDIPVLLGDRAKIGSAAGWEPVVDLDQTLKDVLSGA
ncbi:MAG TPA: GDP-mannose 4,6-dehydratase [Acidimicrobiales bacterium]|nr:GDP-mannose 4,6-dehydratase [Acidimicrobiales bacterium]